MGDIGDMGVVAGDATRPATCPISPHIHIHARSSARARIVRREDVNPLPQLGQLGLNQLAVRKGNGNGA